MLILLLLLDSFTAAIPLLFACAASGPVAALIFLPVDSPNLSLLIGDFGGTLFLSAAAGAIAALAP